MEEWLRSIGLGGRYPAFRDHGITVDQLHDLSEEDLRELGLTIGERKRFRTAVRSLEQSSALLLRHAPVVEQARAERRPLTVMFVDLVNSSGLGEQLEAEDLLEVIRDYREFAGVAIRRFGGTIGRLVGDGILAYFCYPIATENDPERAVRAALEIVQGISSLKAPTGVPLDVHIGIATGQVIVSDIFAGGSADRASIIGSTPNLAARLQGLAPPGGIVIAENTYARVGGIFVCEELGRQHVRSFTQAHNAWRVIGEVREGRRARRKLTPFYGRQAELGILGDRLHRARSGEGAAVVVTGEPGIGKSRLIGHFLATCLDNSIFLIRLAGSPFDENSTLYPVIAFLRRLAHIDSKDVPDAQSKKLEAVLAGDGAARQAALPVLADLIGISGDDARLRAQSPTELRERMLTTLIDQILLLSAKKPLCLVVEDLQWLDPTTLELLERVIDRIDYRSVLILLSARDGFTAPWTMRRSTTLVRLVPLSPIEVAGMVRSLFVDTNIPDDLGRIIARRTDGIPLFVEELARTLLQQQSSSLSPRGSDSTRITEQAVPATLRESLMARLDRAGIGKEIAQKAAVIGRAARRDVLAAVASLPERELEAPLAALLETGALVQAPVDGVEGYRFSHALLRDAAYDSLLRDDRRRLHLRVASTLTALDPQTAAQQPELIAMHLTEGDDPEAAAPYWIEAAKRSLARSALTEATRMLTRGLEALEKLPANESVKRFRLQLTGLLGPALIGLKGPGSPEAQSLYDDAFTLCSEMPEDPAHFPIYWGWWRVSQGFGTWLTRSDVIMRRAVERGHPEFLLQAHHSKWASHYHAGEFAPCCEHIAAGLAIYERGDYRHHATLYGNHDPKVCAHGELAQLLWMQGKPCSAFAAERVATEWAELLDHHGSRLHASDTSLLYRVYRRDYQEVFRRATELVNFTSAHALSDHHSKGLIFRGWITAIRDDAARGLQNLQEGLAHQRGGTAREDFPVYLCLFAEALIAAGHSDIAIDELGQALREFDRLELQSWRSEVLRMLGESILAADPSATERAETLFGEACNIAQRQGVAMLGLRAAVSFARLDLRLDRVPTAERRLAAAIAAVSEDDDGPDLRDARSLSQQVSERLGSGSHYHRIGSP